MRISTSKFGVGGVIAFFAFAFAMLAAFITHIVWIVTTLMASEPTTGGQIVLAVLGVLAPPVGAIHGFVLWF